MLYTLFLEKLDNPFEIDASTFTMCSNLLKTGLCSRLKPLKWNSFSRTLSSVFGEQHTAQSKQRLLHHRTLGKRCKGGNSKMYYSTGKMEQKVTAITNGVQRLTRLRT